MIVGMTTMAAKLTLACADLVMSIGGNGERP